MWGGLTGKGVTPPVTQAQTEHLPNQPFAIDDPKGFNSPLGVGTRDLWHRFYQNQMQIDGGKNDKFVAYADSGALVMGHYDGSKLPLWQIAQQYTLADNFFMGALRRLVPQPHWLVCACTPYYPNADQSPAKGSISRRRARRRDAHSWPPIRRLGDRRRRRNSSTTATSRRTSTPSTRCSRRTSRARNKPAEGGDPALCRSGEADDAAAAARDRPSAIC